MSLNKYGIPSLKDLYRGVSISLKNPKNRHLALAAEQCLVHNKVLKLELSENDPDDEDDEDEVTQAGKFLPALPSSYFFDEDEDEEEEDEDDYGEDFIEECPDYKKGCLFCEEDICVHDELTGHEYSLDLVISIGSAKTQKVIPEDHSLMDNSAFMRFLNQINETHDL